MKVTKILCQVAPIFPVRVQPIIGETLDNVFYEITNMLTEPCFTGGWGEPELLKDIIDLSYQAQQSEHYEARKDLITKNICVSVISDTVEKKEGIRLITGKFRSTAAHILPKESEDCVFQLIVPQKRQKEQIPLVIQYSMTGDHGFSLRRDIGFQLLKKHNIASISIINPFYGVRKPHNQKKSSLVHVSDLMCKGVALVCEGLSLIEYFKDNQEFGNFGPFGVTGISMGGHMAALAGCNSIDPIAVIPCLSPYSASPVFTEGLLSKWVDWDTLDASLPTYLTKEQTDAKMDSKGYMRYLLDSTTDITRFPPPKSLKSTIQVSAKHDRYVPGTGKILFEHWKGSELRWTPYSHVSGIVLGRSEFVAAIADSFQILMEAKFNKMS